MYERAVLVGGCEFYWILFIAPDGKRKTVRLGKVPMRTAESVKVKIEALNAVALARHPVDDETARWVVNLDAILAAKLIHVGLVAPLVEAGTITLG